ncbi:MAG: hypothetical protein ACP5I1_15575, partial [Candidatus Hinthialibacter sp.]
LREDGILSPSVENESDGDDYIEGAGGADVIFGNLGQDDIIGGSSDLFGLTAPEQRPDGSDLIFGGAGVRTGINEELTDSNRISIRPEDEHARDSDVILGDNGRIFRLVDASGDYLRFNYDQTRASEPFELIVARAVESLDYEYTNNGDVITFSGLGAADEIHGESGDDFIHGMTGGDVIYGDSEDDDLYGEAGNDWISGGTGDDGILGDDGFIFTSRNGTPEPLYGIEAVQEEWIEIKAGDSIDFLTNPNGALKKSVDLEPFDIGGDDYISEGLGDEGLSDDVIYGGLGDDWLHGGAGNDALSGAEALSFFFEHPLATPRLHIGEDGRIIPEQLLINNDGDVSITLEEIPNFYDEVNSLAKIGNHFLNFDAKAGATNKGDGEDVLFGDLGHDWLVGGSGKDRLYGGMGNDIHNADDNLETNDGLNEEADSDTFPYDRDDILYGGGGRDLLIANSGLDRMIDWAGEFNNYVVPFAPFGNFTVIRSPAPMYEDLLYGMSESDGADQTRSHLSGNGRNGEPYGELGLFTQKDSFWKDNTGAPADKQPGNIGGGKKDETGTTTHNDGEETTVGDDSSNQQSPDDVLVFDETTNDLNPTQNTESGDDEQSDKSTPPGQDKDKDKENNGNGSDQSDDTTPPGQEKEKENNG